MDQISFADAEYTGTTMKARRKVFTEKMKRVAADRSTQIQN